MMEGTLLAPNGQEKPLLQDVPEFIMQNARQVRVDLSGMLLAAQARVNDRSKTEPFEFSLDDVQAMATRAKEVQSEVQGFLNVLKGAGR